MDKNDIRTLLRKRHSDGAAPTPQPVKRIHTESAAVPVPPLRVHKESVRKRDDIPAEPLLQEDHAQVCVIYLIPRRC